MLFKQIMYLIVKKCIRDVCCKIGACSTVYCRFFLLLFIDIKILFNKSDKHFSLNCKVSIIKLFTSRKPFPSHAFSLFGVASLQVLLLCFFFTL